MYNIDTTKAELPYYQEILLHFKVNPCLASFQKNPQELAPSGQICGQFFCFNYHNLNEKRRFVFEDDSSNFLYQPMKCPSIAENIPCPNGDSCRYAHTQNEINFHPLFYKTEPCAGCFFDSNSKFCPFYHADEISRKVMLEKLKTKGNKDNLKTQQQNPSMMSQGGFNLENFKAKPCLIKGNHNPKVCEFYHHENDRKRPVSIYHYTSNMCQNMGKGDQCPRGDNCNYCHNKVEQLYHPERYKRKFCLSHPHNVFKCEYGNFCSFAHSENEIQIELLHNLKKDENFYLYKYKTVFCPYIYEHDRNQCVYAHNPQDYRRDPVQFKYNPIQCTFWSQNQIFSYEEGACPNGMQCEQCHGWKELEYHPLYYKTKPCNNGKKCNKRDCPFYHSNAERRDTRPNSQLTQTLLGPQGLSQFNTSSSQKISSTVASEVDPNIGFGTLSTGGKFGNQSGQSQGQGQKGSYYGRQQMQMNYQSGGAKTQQEYPGSYNIKSKKTMDLSTQPSSNISSTYFSEEDPATLDKKKKGKLGNLGNIGNIGNLQQQQQQGQASYKKEKSRSPKSAKSDKQMPQIMKDPFADPEKLWEPTQKKDEEKLFAELFGKMDLNKPRDETKPNNNDSFESFPNSLVEKNVNITEKQQDAGTSKFLKILYSKLEKKGLGHTIQYIKNANVDIEALKSFNPKNFYLFPQISTEDKEKIVRIILDIIEGEAILSEINTIHEEHLIKSFPQNSGEDSDFFTNLGTYESTTDSNSKKYLHRHSY